MTHESCNSLLTSTSFLIFLGTSATYDIDVIIFALFASWKVSILGTHYLYVIISLQ
jgi:hypothetical protein